MYSSSTVLLTMLFVSACTFDGVSRLPIADDSGIVADAAGEAEPEADAELGCQNFATHFDACSIAPESGDELSLSDKGVYTYNTNDGVLTDPAGIEILHDNELVTALEGDIRVVVANSFVLGRDAILRPEGIVPLAIGTYEKLSIEGKIDVSQGGAGSRQQCGVSGGTVGGEENGGGGGGGGGAFQGKGGNGGWGNGDGNNGALGPGGLAAGLPASPLGGCAGGNGGEGEDPGGTGGVGGGAIYLASGTEIHISGEVDAGGAGGQGGDESGGGFGDAGGAGGGSGGYVLLEAPILTLSGIVAANGGSGGEGSGNRSQGNNGNEGALSSIAASGGAGGSPTGTDGAVGSAGIDLDGGTVTEAEPGGGGGGGGGAGFIIVATVSPMIDGVVSPNLSRPWVQPASAVERSTTFKDSELF